MSEKWITGFCSSRSTECLLPGFLWFLGTALVQAKTFKTIDKPAITPFLCTFFLCCVGAGCNRKNIRKYYKIQGNF